jgi:hypothetical protein
MSTVSKQRMAHSAKLLQIPHEPEGAAQGHQSCFASKTHHVVRVNQKGQDIMVPSKEEFENEVHQLIQEITAIFVLRYPKELKEHGFHMLSALSSLAANILSNLNDPKMDKMFIEQVQSHTQSIRDNKRNAKGPELTGKIPTTY